MLAIIVKKYIINKKVKKLHVDHLVIQLPLFATFSQNVYTIFYKLRTLFLIFFNFFFMSDTS